MATTCSTAPLQPSDFASAFPASRKAYVDGPGVRDDA